MSLLETVAPIARTALASSAASNGAARVFIRHKTQYDFEGMVILNAHALLLRPRESPSLRLVSFELRISPDAQVIWSEDVYGNAVATAVFQKPATQVVIEAVSSLDLKGEAWPVFRIEPGAMSYPFCYSDNDCIDLGAMMVPQYSDPNGQLRNWVHAFVEGHSADTLSLLKALNAGVCAAIAYEARDSEGTQSPVATLLRARGSCRDLAVLFVEAARSLGFGARLVSGYLNASDNAIGRGGPYGATHAWAAVYLPGAGWVAFDPTNRRVGGYNLIPVAVGREIRTLSPVAGSFSAPEETKHRMSVDIRMLDATAEGAGGRGRGNHLPAGRGA